MNRLKYLPRPRIVHFVRVLDRDNAAADGVPGEGKSVGENTSGEDDRERTLPSFTDGESI